MKRFSIEHSGWGSFAAARLAWLALAAGVWLSSQFCGVPTVAAATLTELLGGGSITVGDCRFTDWQLVSMSSTGTAPNLSQVLVNPLVNDLGNPGIQFAGNHQLAVAGVNSLDLELKYRVQALSAGNKFEGHSLTIANMLFGSGGGLGFVSDGLTTGPGAQLDSAVAIQDPFHEVFQPADAVSFASTSGVLVTTNIFLQGLSTVDAINLVTFNQRFLQTGAPVLEGDYNENGVVDAADYTVWRNKLGAAAGTLPNDTAGGVIGAAQFDLWKSKFGQVGGGALAGRAAAAVPEAPTILSLAAWWIVAAGRLPRPTGRWGLT